MNNDQPENPNSGRPSQADLAWAAGFLDGEGCIHIAKRRGHGGRTETYRLGVHVTQNQRGALESFCQAVGISAPIYKTKLAANHRRQCYTLNFTGHSALLLLQRLCEFLRRKREEAEAVFEFWVRGAMGLRGRGKRLDPALLATREHYFQLLKQLK